MPRTARLGLRLPEGLNQEVERIAKERGVTVTSLAEEGLRIIVRTDRSNKTRRRNRGTKTTGAT